MKQDRRIAEITLRGLDPRLQEEIRRLANSEGLSLNRAALRLLKKGAGISDKPARETIGHSMDHLFGTWNEKESRTFQASIRSCEQVDPEFWD